MNQIIRTGIILLIIAGCGDSEKMNSRNSDSWDNEELIMATLYNYYSAEYLALSYQAYNIATERLIQIALNSTNNSNLAVVVDIDETILDNSPFQAMSIESGKPYPAYWDDWCNLAVAKPVPGALEFLNCADSLGFKVFYISNRKIDPVYEGTFRNLTNLGFPQVNIETIMLRGSKSEDNPEPSDKEQRRRKVESLGYTIVMLVGDNLGDFFIDDMDKEARSQIVNHLREEFGNRYIILPNAMYGSWPASIGIDGMEETYRRLIKEMTTPFHTN